MPKKKNKKNINSNHKNGRIDKKPERERRSPLSRETKKGIWVVVLSAIAVISILGLFELAGKTGEYIVDALKFFFGWGKWAFPVILLLTGYLLINEEKLGIKSANYLGIFLFVLAYSGLAHLFFLDENSQLAIFEGRGGGYLGLVVSYPLNQILGVWGTLVVLIALLIISLLIIFENSVFKYLSWLRGFGGKIKNNLNVGHQSLPAGAEFSRREMTEEEQGSETLPGEKVYKIKGRKRKTENGEDGENKSRFSSSSVGGKHQEIYPSLSLDLLSGAQTKPASGDIKVIKTAIQKTFENFGIAVEMGEISVGPTVTQYTLKPAEGVKISRITALSNDLALALAAHPIRIEAPIPGKSLVGIEVPNLAIAVVRLREILESEEFKKRSSNLNIVLGKDVAGKCWVADLAKMPHLLVAGATGSGKTICLNSIIVSLLYQNTPAEMKMILVDPKRVEMVLYNGIPHLITPVVMDVKKTVNALKWAVAEMDRRFDLLSRAGKRDIEAYNSSAISNGQSVIGNHSPQDGLASEDDKQMENLRLPYIVIVIDELADLMATAGAEVEALIIRLAQMARAVGIHLIMATQRPSVDVITGLIKANITSRIAFSVASATDSRTILDFSGAEKLLGRGDMLFVAPWLSKPKRLQGAYVSNKEIETIANFLKEGAEPEYLDEVTQFRPENDSSDFGDLESDELLPDAKEVIARAGKASASLLQRRLKVGYARAARLLDLLEEEGFIGPANGAKPREIINGGHADYQIGEAEVTEEDNAGFSDR